MADGVWAEVERALTALAGEDRFSGSVLVTRGDETLLECPAGIADRASGTPVTTATRFAVASLSKMFTAATVLGLVRDERLAVEDRVVDVLPAARRPRTMADEVTVHHLLTHTSGIGDYAEEDEDLPGYVADYAALWRDRPAYRMERPDDFLPLYADAPPVGRPGEAFHYSNAGYVLLGAVVEEVSGTQFPDAVEEQVFGPAGMTASGYLRSDDAHPDVAIGYLPRTDPAAPWRSNVNATPVLGGGDGGAHTTPRDVDRFLRAIASGVLLGPELSARMRTAHARVGEGVDMGYGLMLRAGGSFAHGGGDPGVETLARHVPALDLSLVLLCNGEGMTSDAWPLLIDAAGV